MAVLNVGSFNTFVQPVLDHESETNSFTYIDDFDLFKKGVHTKIQYSPEHNRYYLDSKLEFLDNPGEWD